MTHFSELELLDAAEGQLAADRQRHAIECVECARQLDDLRAVLARRLTITGSLLRPQSIEEKASIAAAVEANVLPLLESGAVAPVIHAVFPLADAAKAHALMESNRHIGKIVLQVG